MTTDFRLQSFKRGVEKRELPELYMLLVKTGEFIVEFSQLVISILFTIDYSVRVDKEGYFLSDVLDEEVVRNLIPKLRISDDIKTKLENLNKKRNNIVHFEFLN